MKLYYLTRKAVKSNSLVQNICMFLQSVRDITLQRQLSVAPRNPSTIFLQPVYLEKCCESQIPCIPPFSCQKIYDECNFT